MYGTRNSSLDHWACVYEWKYPIDASKEVLLNHLCVTSHRLGLVFLYLNHLFPSIFDNQDLTLHGFSGEILLGSICTHERGQCGDRQLFVARRGFEVSVWAHLELTLKINAYLKMPKLIFQRR